MNLHKEVPKSTVLQIWAEQEYKKAPDKFDFNIENATKKELLTIIKTNGPSRASRLLWQEENKWFEGAITPIELENIKVHKAPDWLGWRNISNDGSMKNAVHTFKKNKHKEVICDNLKVWRVEERLNELQENDIHSIPWNPVILYREEGKKTPWVVDGNHRSLSLLYYLQEENIDEEERKSINIPILYGLQRTSIRDFVKIKLFELWRRRSAAYPEH